MSGHQYPDEIGRRVFRTNVHQEGLMSIGRGEIGVFVAAIFAACGVALCLVDERLVGFGLGCFGVAGVVALLSLFEISSGSDAMGGETWKG